MGPNINLKPPPFSRSPPPPHIEGHSPRSRPPSITRTYLALLQIAVRPRFILRVVVHALSTFMPSPFSCHAVHRLSRRNLTYLPTYQVNKQPRSPSRIEYLSIQNSETPHPWCKADRPSSQPESELSTLPRIPTQYIYHPPPISKHL